MKVIITRGGTKSFAFKYKPKNGLGINIKPGENIIELFQNINKWFLTDELLFILEKSNESML